MSRKREKPITVITRDNIRTLVPHSQVVVKKTTSAVINADDLLKIKNASVYMDSVRLEKNSQEAAETRFKLSEQARNRKDKMEMFDHKRTANAKLSELEQEAKDKSNYLLAKAQMQLEEQEDEIKHLNELMLYAKCVSIRDLQVAEKAYIQKEKKEEDARLDAMAELERVDELKKIEEKEKIRMNELKNGAAKIRQQIMEREELLLLEQDKKDQETKVLLKTLQDMAEAEVKEKMSKIKAQKSLMEDVNAANQQLTERKKLQKLLEEEEDRKVLQYVIDKQKKDEENARAAKQKLFERETELARLRLAQEKVSDKHSQQNALRAQRAFEAHEREWRRKEKEAAEKQAAQEKELREERVKQQDAREYAIAVEAHKMRKEFYENLARQKDLEEKLKKQAIEEHERNKKYALEVKAQIREKEAARRREREEFFAEGVQLAQKRLEQKKRIDSIKERKTQELRGLGVPDKYVKAIERQAHSKSKNSFSMMGKK